MKILILGYSNIVRKRILNVVNTKVNRIFVATKSYKNKIINIEKKYNSYEKALNECKPNLVYISLPNSKHYYWAKKSLNLGIHTIVDKPITSNLTELLDLINISKKKKRLLSESTFYNYHSQFKRFKELINQKNYKKIEAKFIIPMPKKGSILLSKKLCGGVLMDMGPYISSIPRIFNMKNILKRKINIRKNKKNLIISIIFNIKFKNGVYNGKFSFGGNYCNQLKVTQNKNYTQIKRVFSPPDDEVLFIKYLKNKKLSQIKVKKDNCFKNFYFEIKNKIKTKKIDFYYERMKYDCLFRSLFIK